MSGAPKTDQGTAIVLRPQDLTSPYEPTNPTEALALARAYAGSKLTRCRTPEQALLIMGTGRDLGIPATTALRMIYVVDFGQGETIALSADLMVALCLRSSQCEYFRCTATTDERATYATKRRGDPERTCTFSIGDADRAGLKKNPMYARYPAIQLRHRAASILAREVYPDVIGGLYTEDEVEDFREVAAPVGPLPARTDAIPTTAEPAPSAPAEESHESPEDRILRQFAEARDDEALKRVGSEARALWPRDRPESIRAAYAAAKARISGAQGAE